VFFGRTSCSSAYRSRFLFIEYTIYCVESSSSTDKGVLRGYVPFFKTGLLNF
jgi:hypothetical protein